MDNDALDILSLEGEREPHELFLNGYGCTTRKESINEDKMPSQKFKYRHKRLLARACSPRRSSYLFLLLKEILRPCLRKQIIYEGNLLSLLNKFAFVNILPNNEKSLRLIFNESEQSSLTTICENLYTLAISYLRIGWSLNARLFLKKYIQCHKFFHNFTTTLLHRQ